MLLKEWRWENRVTQKQLARLLQCSSSQISLVEAKVFSARSIYARFVNVFGLDTAKTINEFKDILHEEHKHKKSES